MLTTWTTHNRYQAYIEQAKGPAIDEYTRPSQYGNVSYYTIGHVQVSLSADDAVTETKLNRLAAVFVE
ncbi:MAG: hypothetical protein Q9196_002492 [Gyalolechia fulgens]